MPCGSIADHLIYALYKIRTVTLSNMGLISWSLWIVKHNSAHSHILLLNPKGVWCIILYHFIILWSLDYTTCFHLYLSNRIGIPRSISNEFHILSRTTRRAQKTAQMREELSSIDEMYTREDLTKVLLEFNGCGDIHVYYTCFTWYWVPSTASVA